MRNIYRKTGIVSYLSYLAFFIIIMLSQTIFAVVDINQATEEELARELSGIGPIKARRIVEYRDKINGFVSIEQLMEIKGIGLKTFARNREKIAQIAQPMPTKRLNISPQIEKSPHQAHNLFWDALIIMPLFIVCIFIFISAWLKSA
jgi:competence protein ComEA